MSYAPVLQVALQATGSIYVSTYETSGEDFQEFGLKNVIVLQGPGCIRVTGKETEAFLEL